MKKGTLTACDHDETKVVYPRGLLEGCPLCCEQGLREKKEKTIQSLVEEKYTRYGDGYGFLASDSCGQKVWVNSTSIALEQKDEEIKELQDKLKGKNAEVERLRGLLQDALPHIKCNNASQSGLITAIGQTLKGGD